MALNLKKIRSALDKTASTAVSNKVKELVDLVYDLSPVYTGAYKASHKVSFDLNSSAHNYSATPEEQQQAKALGNQNKGRNGIPVARFVSLIGGGYQENVSLLFTFNIRKHKSIIITNGASSDSDGSLYSDQVEYYGWAFTQPYMVYQTAIAEFARGG